MPDLEARLAAEIVIKALRQVVRLGEFVLLVVDIQRDTPFSSPNVPQAPHASAFRCQNNVLIAGLPRSGANTCGSV